MEPLVHTGSARCAGAHSSQQNALQKWQPAPLTAQFQERNAQQLTELFPRLAGEVLLAEPGRQYAQAFLDRFHAEPVGERIYRLACS